MQNSRSHVTFGRISVATESVLFSKSLSLWTIISSTGEECVNSGTIVELRHKGLDVIHLEGLSIVGNGALWLWFQL